jgi:hypothetical protein
MEDEIDHDKEGWSAVPKRKFLPAFPTAEPGYIIEPPLKKEIELGIPKPLRHLFSSLCVLAPLARGVHLGSHMLEAEGIIPPSTPPHIARGHTGGTPFMLGRSRRSAGGISLAVSNNVLEGLRYCQDWVSRRSA